MSKHVQIRRNVFETNSSSSHSLTLSESDTAAALSYTPADIQTGELHITARSFGWEWCRYHLLVNKLAYFLADQATHAECTSASMTAEDLPGPVARVLQVIEDHIGAKIVITPEASDYDEGVSLGSVDHESVGTISEMISASDAEIIKFFTQIDSYIETGNDNSTAPRYMWRDIEGAAIDLYADMVVDVSMDYRATYIPTEMKKVYDDDREYVLEAPGIPGALSVIPSILNDFFYQQAVVDYVTFGMKPEKGGLGDVSDNLTDVLTALKHQGMNITKGFRVVTVPEENLRSTFHPGTITSYLIMEKNDFNRSVAQFRKMITGRAY